MWSILFSLEESDSEDFCFLFDGFSFYLGIWFYYSEESSSLKEDSSD